MLNQFTLEMHYMLCSKNTLRLLHYRKSIRDALMQKSNKIIFCTNALEMTCREQTLEILNPFGYFHCAVVNITFLTVVNFTQCFIDSSSAVYTKIHMFSLAIDFLSMPKHCCKSDFDKCI